MNYSLKGSRKAAAVLFSAVLLLSACNWLWPLEGKYDPTRCDPACSGGEICYEGKCGPPKLDWGSSDLGAVVPATWVTIKAGNFIMGSPTSEQCRDIVNETQHSVTLSNKFEMQSTEVTQDQFFLEMKYRPSLSSTCGGRCPVENVNWHEAAAYRNMLSKKSKDDQCYECVDSGKNVTCGESPVSKSNGIYKCKGYRLPTEAEWEYAYRAGTTTAFYNGDITNCTSADPKADEIGWYQVNSGNKPNPVGQKSANGWSLYDMAGNVWEWCHDWYKKDLKSQALKDPVESGSGATKRVFRGGSWGHKSRRIRAAGRSDHDPTKGREHGGFRCVRTIVK